MKFTAQQIGIINLVIQTNADGSTRNFPLSELSTASDIYEKLMKNVKDNNFVDGNVDLTSEQNVFISKLLDERSWSVLDASHVFALKDKIK